MCGTKHKRDRSKGSRAQSCHWILYPRIEKQRRGWVAHRSSKHLVFYILVRMAEPGKSKIPYGKRTDKLEEVDKKRKSVLARYKELQATSQQRREKLEQAKQLQLFQRDANGLEAWIIDKTRIASDESYKDRRNLQVEYFLSGLKCLLY